MSDKTYTPDTWTVVKVINGEKFYYRILAGWGGGYTYGASWKLSSGIEQIVEEDDRYVISNASGSTYVCRKGAPQHTSYTMSILKGFQGDIGVENIFEEPIEEAILYLEYLKTNGAVA